MRAVWYDRQGPAADVLQVGELPDPEPGPGEVRVRVRCSAVNPGEVIAAYATATTGRASPSGPCSSTT